MNSKSRHILYSLPMVPVLVLAGAYLNQAWAEPTDLADLPITVSADENNLSLVKPNIAFIVDDSGSMNDQNMPDADGTNKSKECWGWYKYNTLAYNPNYTYKPPYHPNHPDSSIYSDGVRRLPDADFGTRFYNKNKKRWEYSGGALEDGYFSLDGVTFGGSDGSNDRRNLHKLSNTPTDDYYYTKMSSNHAQFNSAECQSDSAYTAITDPDNIEAPNVATGSAAALTNYANWYSYYRRRAYLMKAAAGEAFKDLNPDKYRVGLFFINSIQSGASNTNRRNNDLKIENFSGTHKVNWYNRLYGNRSNGWTPLRGALARVGRMYAGQVTGWDPVQYSCQQNFTILSTDGYWNTQGENSGYAASQVKSGDGQVGNVDGTAVTGLEAPYLDKNNDANTLADVAYYYYSTDLRDGDAFGNCTNSDKLTSSDLCENNVRTSGDYYNTKQHMVTYTVGLGVSGDIPYEENYEGGPTPIMNGTPWPEIPTDVRPGDGYPHINTDIPAKTDDLWHAAINGRGRYFSAKDPTSLTEGLRAALAKMSPQNGNAAAAASSSLEQSEDMVYVALYRTVKWDGDVEALEIDFSKEYPDNVIRPPKWNAKNELHSKAPNERRIYYLNSNKELREFTYAKLTEDGKADQFDNICNKLPRAGQCGAADGDLNAAQKTLANSGENLVNYLRGSSQFEMQEDNAAANRIYRDREYKLGDIVHSNPQYVKWARFGYSDPSYRLFADAAAQRAPRLYVGANDGMLHAFDTVTGEEVWAYVPGSVMPNMWQLADRDYGHRYFADGPLTVADVCTNVDPDTRQCSSQSDWRTILIAGLNKGGCGYYALDVTDPNNPVGLWEVTADSTGMANLGFSFGNPIVTKNKAGKWVVMFASGHNNIPNGCTAAKGDGNGHVFILDAADGSLINTLSTTVRNNAGDYVAVGSQTTPSGLAKLNVWINDPANPVADRVYGADLLGNVWRFDYDGNYAGTFRAATRLAVLKDDAGNRQPVTTKPELATFNIGGVKYEVVVVGTGKLLGEPDLRDKSQQSLYVLKDELSGAGISDVRAGALTEFDLTADGRKRNIVLEGYASGASVDWASKQGWVVDFNADNASPGERVNIDMELIDWDDELTVWFGTNVPHSDPCVVGGYGIEYEIDLMNPMTNGLRGGAGVGDRFLTTLFTGLKSHVRVNAAGGLDRIRVVTGADGSVHIRNFPKDPEPGCEEDCSGSGGTPPEVRRTAWREIVE